MNFENRRGSGKTEGGVFRQKSLWTSCTDAPNAVRNFAMPCQVAISLSSALKWNWKLHSCIQSATIKSVLEVDQVSTDTSTGCQINGKKRRLRGVGVNSQATSHHAKATQKFLSIVFGGPPR